MRRRSSAVSRWSGRPEARCSDSAADGQRTRLGLFGRTEAAPGHEQLSLVRLERFPQQREVARPVRHGAEERMDVCRWHTPLRPAPALPRPS